MLKNLDKEVQKKEEGSENDDPLDLDAMMEDDVLADEEAQKVAGGGDISPQKKKREIISNRHDTLQQICGLATENKALDKSEPIANGRYGKHGAKIQRIVQALKYIKKTDPSGKAILFCQWDNLRNKITAALNGLLFIFHIARARR